MDFRVWILDWRLLAIWFVVAAAVGAQAAADPAVIRSRQSGPWSAAATWEGGRVPAAGARVLILGGHTVTYDVKSDEVIRAINVSGRLKFARDRDTLLNTGLIKIEAGDVYSENGFDCEGHFDEVDPDQPRATLAVGMPNEPIPAEYHGNHPAAFCRRARQAVLPGDRLLRRADGFSRGAAALALGSS